MKAATIYTGCLLRAVDQIINLCYYASEHMKKNKTLFYFTFTELPFSPITASCRSCTLQLDHTPPRLWGT